MNDMYSFGNTVMSLFSEWSGNNYYHFYIRKQTPRNRLVKAYFNISSTDAVKALLKGRTGGRSFTAAELESVTQAWAKEEKTERGLIEGARSGKRKLIYFLEESFWATRIWQNAGFRDFVQEADPDIFFAFATNSYILDPLIKYLKTNTRAKLVLFIADDMLTAYGTRGWIRRRRLTNKLKRCIASADMLFGISEMMCQHYGELFEKPVEFLCKGCDCFLPIQASSTYPLKLVYAGNLLYGRDQTLANLAEALSEINAEAGEQRAILQIYSTTDAAPEIRSQIERSGAAQVLPPISYEELLRVTNAADFVLHAESFQPEIAEKIRYSFSTKITDCLQSGAGIIAVGPDGLASIEFLKQCRGVEIVTNPGELKQRLSKVISDLETLNQNKQTIRLFAETKLSSANMRKKLRTALEEMIGAQS